MSNAHGMPGLGGVGGGGMLRLQIDRYITKYLALNNKGRLSLKLSNVCFFLKRLYNINDVLKKGQGLDSPSVPPSTGLDWP